MSKLDKLEPGATTELSSTSSTPAHTTAHTPAHTTAHTTESGPVVAETVPTSSEAMASTAGTVASGSDSEATADHGSVSPSSSAGATPGGTSASQGDSASALGATSTPTSDTDATATSEPTTVGSDRTHSHEEPVSTTDDATTEPELTTNPDGSPTFFAPTYGLLAWFDAADDASFAAGSVVAAWNDRSGNANHLAQAVSSGQPTRVTNAIGGLPGVRFDGSNDTLTTSTALTNRAFHGLLVWQSTRVPPSTKSTLIANSRNFEVNHGHVAPTARAGVSACAGVNCYTTNSGWYDAKFDKGAASGTAYLWQFYFVEASNDLVAEAWGGLPVTQVNPTELPVTPATPLYVGNCELANCAFLGDVGEIVLFNRTLTSDEHARAVAYLTTKWSLSEPSN